MIDRCHSRFDSSVTFHIIFQGQYLPPGFSWDTLAYYYRNKGKKRETVSSLTDEEETQSKRDKVSENPVTES